MRFACYFRFLLFLVLYILLYIKWYGSQLKLRRHGDTAQPVLDRLLTFAVDRVCATHRARYMDHGMLCRCQLSRICGRVCALSTAAGFVRVGHVGRYSQSCCYCFLISDMLYMFYFYFCRAHILLFYMPITFIVVLPFKWAIQQNRKKNSFPSS